MRTGPRIWFSMVAIALITPALVALRYPNRLLTSAQLTLTVVALLAATLGARICEPPRKNDWWAFALFGWSYLTLTSAPLFSSETRSWIITSPVIDGMIAEFGPAYVVEPLTNFMIDRNEFTSARWCIERALHAQFALFSGCLGVVAARAIRERERRAVPDHSTSHARSEHVEVASHG